VLDDDMIDDAEFDRSDPSDECYQFTQTDMAQQSFPMLQELRLQGKLLDVQVQVGQSCRVSAHKVVLAATVPYFAGMFTNNLIEATQNEIRIREEWDGAAFEAVIDFAYTGTIRIRIDNVQQILVISSFLGLDRVVDACSEFLHPRLQASNVLGIRAFAETHHMSRLVTSSNKFIDRYFVPVSQSEEFAQLTCDEVVSIVSRNELNINSEESVYEAVMEWVKRDTSSRQEDLPKLLAHVRLPLLTPQFLTDSVASESLIKRCHSCRYVCLCMFNSS
jgi:kelch-like protein 18